MNRTCVRLCVGVLLALGLQLAGEQRAAASPNYPAILDKHFGVDCPRPLTRCLICHVTAAGGEGTAKQPFAEMLVNDYGFSGGKAGRELAMLLDALPADLDTDADGTPDLEELENCHNPSGEELSEGPGYGCAVVPSTHPGGDSSASGRRDTWFALSLALLLGAGWARRRVANS